MPRSPRSAANRAPRAAAPPADVAALTAPQLDLFPSRPVIERLEPRTIVGPRTGVHDVVRVRLTRNGPAHLVFHDRHGWYCETDGPACPAVAFARGANTGAPPA
jgi:hypothetical protein